MIIELFGHSGAGKTIFTPALAARLRDDGSNRLRKRAERVEDDLTNRLRIREHGSA
jgi:adenylylsulfate kinase-like enzyme